MGRIWVCGERNGCRLGERDPANKCRGDEGSSTWVGDAIPCWSNRLVSRARVGIFMCAEGTRDRMRHA